MADTRPTIRIDKWLWYARFFKTRGLASKVVTGGHVRVNSDRIGKSSHTVGPDDTLTFPQAKTIRVVRILDVGTRRGPAPEAQALYEDLTPEPKEPRVLQASAPKFDGKGRPNRKERRNAAAQKWLDLE